MKRYSMFAVAVVLSMVMLSGIGEALAEGAWTPYHEQFDGPRVPVHYVRLKAKKHPAAEAYAREMLAHVHESCRKNREAMALAGEMPGPYRPLSPEGLPESPRVEEVEIYYGREKSVVARTITDYYIDINKKRTPGRPEPKADCGLVRVDERVVHITADLSACDLTFRGGMVFVGQKCEASEAIKGRLARESSAPGQPGLPSRRDRIEQHLRHLPAQFGPTGEWRTIANQRCQVYGSAALIERCVAQPEGVAPDLLSALNGGLPGLLLQQRSDDLAIGLHYQAQEVVLDKEVSEKIFEIPEGGRVVRNQRLPASGTGQ